MTLKEYLENILGKDFEKYISVSKEIEKRFDKLKYIGLIEEDINLIRIDKNIEYLEYLSVVETLPNGEKRPINDIREIDLAITKINSSINKTSREGIISADKILYIIMKAQERFDIFDRVLPHTENIITSLFTLNFPTFGFKDIAPDLNNAREIAKSISPYQIASKNNENPNFKERLNAKILGNEILRHIYYDRKENFLGAYFTPDSKVLSKLLTQKSHPIIGEIIENIFTETQKIIHEYNEDEIKQITSRKNNFDYDKNTYKNYTMMFPKATLIYACSVMNDEVTSLFDYDLEYIINHTIQIKKDYNQNKNENQ